jgi:hypothetical protein
MFSSLSMRMPFKFTPLSTEAVINDDRDRQNLVTHRHLETQQEAWRSSVVRLGPLRWRRYRILQSQTRREQAVRPRNCEDALAQDRIGWARIDMASPCDSGKVGQDQPEYREQAPTM